MDAKGDTINLDLSQLTGEIVAVVDEDQKRLTSPLLLIAIVAGMGGAYIIRLKSAEGKIKLFNKELSVIQQYCILGMLCFPIFYVAGAGSAVFWVLGASFFTIMLHATTYAIEASPPEESFELQLQTV
ncbi:hypothetical protein HPB49_008029 [Dermacentor silvarum]|uniref:Uncharacterized protein n=1 Tax=Dermacentor silvarum TaxID=543639 RepID=A0ACB8CJU3_DERSI|nr:hypothetical protein HPB49_008029 [Dermacentor silvarum]